jgi:diguanylate cyclase (GGDEF)-like protein
MLLNRRALQELLADLVQGGQNGRSTGTLILIHVDHFQTCNDTYGPATGDRVLQHAARIIREGLLGMSASAARLEGTEFAIVLSNDSLDIAKTVVDQISQGALRTNFRDGGLNIAVTLSGGLVRIQKSSSDVEPMSQASQALSAAKAAGNNRWFFFDGQKCVPLEQASARKPGAAEESATAGSRDPQPDPAPGLERGKDRRAHRRQKCSGIYQVASYTPGIPPSEEEFLNTRVADVSAGGCALLLSSPPTSKWFVVALKKPGEIVYVKAEVVHLKRARTENAAAPLFIAGCRFTGRISAPAPRQELQEV